jgi:hypothetical protein
MYRPTDDEAASALTVARRRNSKNGGQTNLPGGETATEEELLHQHYAACLSEITVSRLMNRAWTGCGKGSHGIKDVGGWWEVRAITDAGHGLLVREKDDQHAAVALVYVDKESRWCEALGWEYAHFVRAHGRELGSGTDKPCWILAQHSLQPFPLPEVVA